jgi:hypothetical protein
MIYKRPVSHSDPAFYQSSLFSVKHNNVTVKLKEIITFKVEVEVQPDVMRNMDSFDDIYEALNQQMYINADFYTNDYEFEDNSSEDEDYLCDYDITKLSKSNRAEYFIDNPYQ